MSFPGSVILVLLCGTFLAQGCDKPRAPSSARHSWAWDNESQGSLRISKFSYGQSNLGSFGRDKCYMRVTYPQGSGVPSHKPTGGVGFYIDGAIPETEEAWLEYDVYFYSRFDWVVGGKLPGLYGGHHSCTGGNPATDCFSARLMWREDGKGEVYMYMPRDKQQSHFCDRSDVICHEKTGWSIGRGNFRFQKGSAYTHIKEHIILNTFSGRTPNKDGLVELFVNGDSRAAIRFDSLVLRNTDDIKVKGIDFETFFGGGSNSETPKKVYTQFKNLLIYS